MNDIVSIISTLGFPIFASIMMFVGMKYVYDKERASLDGTIAKIGDLTQAVNHNSETISRLVEEVNQHYQEYAKKEVNHESN